VGKCFNLKEKILHQTAEKSYNDRFHTLYSSPTAVTDQINKDEMGEAPNTCASDWKLYKFLIENPVGDSYEA
jgi:hypothetical protein